MTKIYGFTLLRNGIKFDYPFVESLLSLTELCDESFIAHGDSDDGTEEFFQSIPRLKVINTIWDPTLMGDGGKILSQQTNIALQTLRDTHQEEGAWAFYLQTDELIHERDIPQIKSDIEKAKAQGCDAIRFRYFHFWLNHNQVAISKRWYPQEIRAIKLKSVIQSHGDAQGFSGATKIFESDVHIYHYGHVRDREKREKKQNLLLEMIRPHETVEKYRKREEKDFARTETLLFFGSHPKWMKERIEKFGDTWLLPKKERVILSDNFPLSDQEIWSHTVEHSQKAELTLKSHWLEKLGLKRSIPYQMKNKNAREWSSAQRAHFLLWSHHISTL